MKDRNEIAEALATSGYIADGELATAISLMQRLRRPLLLEGEAGVGKTTADRLMERLIPRVEALKIGTSIDPSADYGPLVTAEAVAKVRNYIDIEIGRAHV